MTTLSVILPARTYLLQILQCPKVVLQLRTKEHMGDIPHPNHLCTATEDSGQAQQEDLSSSWTEGGYQRDEVWTLECVH